MPRLLPFLLFLVLPMAAVHSAWGQGAEIGITVGQSVFTRDNVGTLPVFEGPDQEVSLRDGVRIGARLSVNSWEFLGHEISYAYQSSGLNFGEQDQGGMTVQNFYYNFVAHATRQGTVVRPFVTGGGGFSSFFPPGFSSFSGQGDTKFGYNYGAGLKIKLTEIYGIRFDVRDHVTSKPFNLPNSSGRLHNVEYSAGFSLLF